MRNLFLILLLGNCVWLHAQDSAYTRKVINALTSEYMSGRGYVKEGDKRAAFYLQHLYGQLQLQSFDNNYFQSFSFDINRFPGKLKVRLGKTLLKPGTQYIVNASSGSAGGRYGLYRISNLLNFNHDSVANKIVVIDKPASGSSEELYTVYNNILSNKYGAAGIMVLEEKKLTWSVSTSAFDHFVLHVLKSSYNEFETSCFVKIEQEKIRHHTQNVIGYVAGSIPDTFIVFTAHYDHLGLMGSRTMFPGANDNASGTSMLINLAKHYADPGNQPKYSMAFIAFAGEEAGLIGSEYYTIHPLFPLSKIKFLINMDLLGTGDDGLMVVNATEFETEYNRLAEINSMNKFLPKTEKRGKAKNSDHYWFTEKGVASFFIYTLGGIAAYHDVYDRPETLPLTGYKSVFNLLIKFANGF